jgi:NitT/TauT family transport system permease protein
MRCLSFVVMIASWQIIATVADSRLVPGLWQICHAVVVDVNSGVLLHNLLITLRRVVIAFSTAMVLGSVIGYAMGRSRLLDTVLDGWIITLLNIPALITIVLAYVWFGLVETAAVVAVMLNKFPSVVMTLRQGARALDRDYAEMASLYRVGKWRTLRYVTWPQLAPFVFTAARTGLSIVWKIVLVAEALGRGDGIGGQLQLFFQNFDVTRLIAYALVFIAVVQVIEAAILLPLERRATRWLR